MYLIYTDETGTNFSPNVSPFLLYGGLVVHESKVNNLEHQLQKMIAKFLKLDDIKKVELHTSEIFHIIFSKTFKCSKRKKKDQTNCENLVKILENVTVDDFISFTNELIQFLIKMNIPLLVAVINKNDELHKKHHISSEVSSLAYSFKIFINLLDRYLALKNEKGLLIADDFSNQISPNVNTLPLSERIADKNLQKYKELVFLRVLYESLDWKTTGYTYNNIAPMKYEFESKNMFLIDNINYTNSKDSILNQISDFLLFILRKILEDEHDNTRVNKDLSKMVQEIKSSIRFPESSNIIQTGKLNSVYDVILCGNSMSSSIYNNNEFGMCT